MTKHFGSNETLVGKQLSMLDSRNNNFEALNFVARILSREKPRRESSSMLHLKKLKRRDTICSIAWQQLYLEHLLCREMCEL